MAQPFMGIDKLKQPGCWRLPVKSIEMTGNQCLTYFKNKKAAVLRIEIISETRKNRYLNVQLGIEYSKVKTGRKTDVACRGYFIYQARLGFQGGAENCRFALLNQ